LTGDLPESAQGEDFIMNETILGAKAELEAAGLEVKPSGERSLWIAATVKDAGGGIRLSNDASALLLQDDHWVAIFPADGTLNYEVPGDLQELLPLIRRVYTYYRRAGGAFKDAFKHAVPEPDTYLVGRFPPEDQSHPLMPSGPVDVGSDDTLPAPIERCEAATTQSDEARPRQHEAGRGGAAAFRRVAGNGGRPFQWIVS
jgi:hypothetical protein